MLKVDIEINVDLNLQRISLSDFCFFFAFVVVLIFFLFITVLCFPVSNWLVLFPFRVLPNDKDNGKILRTNHRAILYTPLFQERNKAVYSLI